MTSKQIKLAPDLILPMRAVTEKFAFLGRTGSGKTYGASKMAEEMLFHGAQIIVVDPMGVWYGLRLDADGKKPNGARFSDGQYFPTIANYRRVWDALNAQRGYSWDTNPYVWVIEFKKVKQ